MYIYQMVNNFFKSNRIICGNIFITHIIVVIDKDNGTFAFILQSGKKSFFQITNLKGVTDDNQSVKLIKMNQIKDILFTIFIIFMVTKLNKGRKNQHVITKAVRSVIDAF